VREEGRRAETAGDVLGARLYREQPLWGSFVELDDSIGGTFLGRNAQNLIDSGTENVHNLVRGEP
jgi:hypothetical protein